MANKESIIPVEQIESHILQMRGQNVILDRDIARLYGVKPIALRQQVKRNLYRFPEDFILRLTKEEAEFLVSQNVIPSKSCKMHVKNTVASFRFQVAGSVALYGQRIRRG